MWLLITFGLVLLVLGLLQWGEEKRKNDRYDSRRKKP